MSPEQEIQRIKKDYKERWPRLENHAGIIAALSKNDPIKLGEIAAMVVYGGSYQHLASARDQVLVFVKDCDKPVGFDSLESARAFIRTSGKAAQIHLVVKKNETGNWDTVSI